MLERGFDARSECSKVNSRRAIKAYCCFMHAEPKEWVKLRPDKLEECSQELWEALVITVEEWVSSINGDSTFQAEGKSLLFTRVSATSVTVASNVTPEIVVRATLNLAAKRVDIVSIQSGIERIRPELMMCPREGSRLYFKRGTTWLPVTEAATIYIVGHVLTFF